MTTTKSTPSPLSRSGPHQETLCCSRGEEPCPRGEFSQLESSCQLLGAESDAESTGSVNVVRTWMTL
ncbi:hypothetical protein JB92DRAFT_2022827 [Gautieria morchelliformis]|nr:hypothetical protein JB92DRAFT_2022827 [Gautieria morchelliformis]